MTIESRIHPAASQEPSLLDRIGRGLLVGRERELAEAIVCLRHAAAGEGRVLLISGEPGVGKTRLAREIMAQMQAAAGMALSGECYAEGDVPYAPVARIIREGFHQVASLEPHRHRPCRPDRFGSRAAFALSGDPRQSRP